MSAGEVTVELVTMLGMVVTFPIVILGFLLWLAHLEDTLPAAVRRTGRQPDPAPILAVPVGPLDRAVVAAASVAGPGFDHQVEAADEPAPVHLPAQRHGPVVGVHPHGEAEPAPIV